MHKVNSFTKYNSIEIDKKIYKQLSLIVENILKYKNKLNIISIILFGGFGRGEGSVILKNNKIIPLNDYDLFIIVKNNILKYYINYMVFSIILNKTFDTIAKILEIPHIDYLITRFNDLKKLPPRIIFYELKYGSKVLWGEKLLGMIPEYDSKNIPLYEGLVLLFNRMASLIYAYPIFNKNRKLVIEQCVKAIIGCCDALLVFSGDYHYLYEVRCKVFQKIFNRKYKKLSEKIPFAKKLYKKAINFKLYPDYRLFLSENIYDIWKNIAYMYIETFKYCMQKYLKIKTTDTKLLIDRFIAMESRKPITERIFKWVTYSAQLWSNSRKIFKPIFRANPLAFIYASEPFFLMYLYSNKKIYFELAKRYLSVIINIPKNIEPYDFWRMLLFTWSRGVIKI